MAASRSRSRRSVMPVTAECTMSTRAPPAQRSAATHAMFVQLASVETLVPPNFMTIQAEGVRVTCSLCFRLERAGCRLALKLVVEVLEIFLELLVRQHFLEAAPRGLAALALVTDALVHPVEQPVVIGAVLGGTAQEFIVEIESLVVSFRHLAAQIPN